MSNISNFRGCNRCHLHAFSRNKTPVFGKLTYINTHPEDYSFTHYQVEGTDDPINVDVMFIGEAPGRVEDTRGLPFTGPSGRLLEEMIAAAMGLHNIQQLVVYITNIVACRPCDSMKGDNRSPTDAEIYACSERFQAEIAMIAAESVVFLGETAFYNGKGIFKSGTKMYHPAYILRQGGKTSAVYLRFVRDLGEIINASRQEK